MLPIEMTNSNSGIVAAVCKTFERAFQVVRLLSENGLPTESLSVIGLSPDPGDHIVGFYVRNGQPHTLGLNADEVLSTFTHSGILVLPGLGPTLMAGPLVDVMTRVIDTLHETHTTGGTSLVGAGLRSLGVATDRLLHFDNVLNAGEVLILVDTLDTERLAQVTALLEQCEISLMDS